MTLREALLVLGFSGDVVISHSEIKSRFRSLSKQLHPDLATGDDEGFMSLKKAYDCALSSPEGSRVSLRVMPCSIEQGVGIFNYVVDGVSYSL